MKFINTPIPPHNRYVQDYNEADPRTHGGWDLTKMTMSDLYKQFGVDDQTIDFIGHALALHRDDSYLQECALPTVLKASVPLPVGPRMSNGCAFNLRTLLCMGCQLYDHQHQPGRFSG